MELKKITVVKAIIECLQEQGIDRAFGIAGSHYLSFFHALKDSKIKYISVKNESSAGFMALNYTRASGKPALCTGTAGPGAMNLLNGIAELYKYGIPSVILTPTVATDLFGREAFQEDTGYGNTYSICNIMNEVTKKSVLCFNPNTVIQQLRDLIRFGFSAPNGPVHICVPSDIFSKTIEYDYLPSKSYRHLNDQQTESSKIKKLAKLIGDSKLPLLLLGRRTVYPNASKEISNLSIEFGLPVITSHSAKGIYDEHNDLYCGVLSIYGNRTSEVVVKESDLVITIGEELSENTSIKYDPELFKNCKLVSIDSHVTDFGRNYPVDYTICGNIKSTIVELYTELKALKIKPIIKNEFIKQKILKNDSHIVSDQDSTEVPLPPQVIYKVINKTIDNECIVLTDTGSHAFWAIRNLLSYENGFMYSATGFSMGQGIAGSIGAKLGQPDRTVICVAGDGSFLMQGMELATMQQYKIAVIWIIMNDKRYNMIDWGQKLTGGGCEFCVDLYTPKFDKFSEAFGIHYSYADSEVAFSDALSNAIKRSRLENESSFIVVNYNKDTFLPAKPRAVKMLEDIKSDEKIQSNPYLLKAFTNLLKERV